MFSKGETLHRRLLFVPHDFKVLNRSNILNITLKITGFALDYRWKTVNEQCIWKLCGVERYLSTKQLNKAVHSTGSHFGAIIWINSPFIMVACGRLDRADTFIFHAVTYTVLGANSGNNAKERQLKKQ